MRMGYKDMTKHWPKELKTAMQIKAALFTNGDEEKLLQLAIEAYKPTWETKSGVCTECHEEVPVSLIDFQENGVTIHHVPACVCRKCGNTTMNFFLAGTLSEIANDSLSKEIEFSELI